MALVPEPLGQLFAVARTGKETVGEQVGLVVPALLVELVEGVLDCLEVAKPVEGPQHVLAAVDGGAVQIAEEDLDKRVAGFSNRGVGGGDDVGKEGALHGLALAVGQGDLAHRLAVLDKDGACDLLLCGGIQVLQGVFEGHELLDVPQAVDGPFFKPFVGADVLKAPTPPLRTPGPAAPPVLDAGDIGRVKDQKGHAYGEVQIDDATNHVLRCPRLLPTAAASRCNWP